MPRGDKRGPDGEGPMTGRKMGLCVGNDQPGSALSGSELGRGTGRGIGRGTGRGTGRGSGRGIGRGVGRGVGIWRRSKWDASENDSRVNSSTFFENEIRKLKDQVKALQQKLTDLVK